MGQGLEARVAARTEELVLNRDQLLNFIRYAPSAIAFKGLDGRLLLANQRAEALLGTDQPPIAGRKAEASCPAGFAAWIREQDERVLVHRQEVQTEETMPNPDGAIRAYLVQKFPLIDGLDQCWGLGAIATDITEHKAFEQENLQRQKLESLSLLAGGISHDFNNLMGAMIGNVELARMELADEDPVLERLQAIEDLVTRASGLVEQILAYAGKGRYQAQALELNAQVEETTRVLRSSLAGRASLDWEPAPGLPPMEGRQAQIRQVIVNLVLNAVEAGAGPDGLITIRTGLQVLGPDDLLREYPGQALKPGPYLTLEVSDHGRGMSAQVKARIFEPFFTTKVRGRGLGLSAVQGIVRSHAGGIRVVSEEGKGTAIKLLFPPAAVAKIQAEPVLPVFQGKGTVLVVDDEEALRGVAVAALRHMGFETLEARDGLEGLQVGAMNRDRIRLILMNLTMPRMDGEEACLELRRAGVTAPLILSSGFAKEELYRRFQGKGLAGFLPRPYRYQDLVSAVREALADQPEG
jgi:PAS domain S-box-containing protein